MLCVLEAEGIRHLAAARVGSEQSSLGRFDDRAMDVIASIHAGLYPQQVAQVVWRIAEGASTRCDCRHPTLELRRRGESLAEIAVESLGDAAAARTAIELACIGSLAIREQELELSREHIRCKGVGRHRH